MFCFPFGNDRGQSPCAVAGQTLRWGHVVDWWILAFSIIAAIGGAWGAFLMWWRQEISEVHISTRQNAERILVSFAAVGSRPLHSPQAEIIKNGKSIVISDMPPALNNADQPIEIAIPIGTLPAELTAAIQWTEYGIRSPRLRGRKFGSDDQIWEWNNRKGWVPWNAREVKKYRARYSQL